MRIVTFNIRTAARDKWPWEEHFWIKRFSIMKDFVKKENPDIICMQEVSRPQAILMRFIKGYRLFSPSFELGIWKEAQPILVKNGLTVKSKVINVGGRKVNKIIVADVDGFKVSSVHLPLNESDRICDLALMKEVLDYYGCTPDLITGDFNVSGIGSGCIGDVFTEYNVVYPCETTFKNMKNGNEGIIDGFIIKKHEFTSTDIRVIRSYENMSDHYPVLIELNKK